MNKQVNERMNERMKIQIEEWKDENIKHLDINTGSINTCASHEMVA